MTLFTSDTKRHFVRSAAAYLGFTVFLVAFYFVYIQFSFGKDSLYMRFMFLSPLAGGGIAVLCQYLLRGTQHIYRTAFNIWNAGLAAIVAGCLVQSIISISGRTTDNDVPFYWAGGAMLAAAAVILLICVIREKKKRTSD